MSKAFYKPGVSPKLLKSIINSDGSRAVEVWLTPCIVTKFGISSEASCEILINPGNPQLSGVSKFAYFPRGGPVPKDNPKGMFAGWQPLGYVSSWGGMEVGSGMLYSSSVVDGLVHQLGGLRLRMECSMLPSIKGDDEKCPVGHAIKTSTAGKLADEYSTIIHTTPPFYNYNDCCPKISLRECYQNSLKIAVDQFSSLPNLKNRVAVPLLGAGGRGFPIDSAVHIAATESIQWCFERTNKRKSSDRRDTLAFGIPEESTAEMLTKVLEEVAENR